MTNVYEPDVFEGVDFDEIVGSMAEGPCEDKCDWCGAQARWATGKFGTFIACTKYPKCKWTVKKTRLTITEPKAELVAPIEESA